ncbi:hypothetical protein AK812_SmicGene47790, partial [Symbiodinium microadriaticum]
DNLNHCEDEMPCIPHAAKDFVAGVALGVRSCCDLRAGTDQMHDLFQSLG